MKRNSKRLLVSCISVLLLLSLILTGCGGTKAPPKESNNSGNQTTDGLDPIVIKVYNAQAGTNPTKDNKIYKKLKDELGVSFEFEFLVGDAKQKAGIMVAGGKYPDIMGLRGEQSGIELFLDADALVPLEDYITSDKYPNIKKYYGPIIKQLIDPSRGHVYVLPNYGVLSGTVYQNESYGPAFWIQKAVMKELGYPKVKTLDEFFDVIQRYKEKFPTIDGQPTIGFEILTDPSRDWPLRNAPAQLSGYPNDGSVIVDNNIAKIYQDKEVSKKYFKKLNEMYHLNLVDQEAFVMNYDQYIAKLSSGRVLGLYDQRWNFDTANKSLLQQGKEDRQYMPLPITFDTSIKDWYLTNPTLNLNSGFALTVDCKNPDRVMKFFDDILSEEWQKLLGWGIEGEDYLVDTDGNFYRTPQARVDQDTNEWILANKAKEIVDFMPKFQGSFSDGNATSPKEQPGEYFETLGESDKEYLKGYNVQTQGQLFSQPPPDPIYFPCYSISIPQGTDAQIAGQQMQDLAFQYLPQLIKSNSSEFEGLWGKYMNELSKVNTKSYEDVVNAGIQDRIKNWGN